MRNVIGTAIFLSIPVFFVLWQLFMVALLRLFRIQLPWSFAIHIYDRRERELQSALRGLSASVHVLVSGILLLSFPLLAGLDLFHFLDDHYLGFSPYRDNHPYGLDAARIVGSLVVIVAIGVVFGVWEWRRSIRKLPNTDRAVQGGAP